MRTLDIAWLAGILDGEGYFGRKAGSPRINVAMTDKDTIEKIAALWEVEHKVDTPIEGRKQMYSAFIGGYKAAQWMMTLYVFLSERRKEKVRECLERWKTSKSVKNPYSFPCGHPRIEENIAPNGQCRICQQSWKRKDYAKKFGRVNSSRYCVVERGSV